VTVFRPQNCTVSCGNVISPCTDHLGLTCIWGEKNTVLLGNTVLTGYSMDSFVGVRTIPVLFRSI